MQIHRTLYRKRQIKKRFGVKLAHLISIGLLRLTSTSVVFPRVQSVKYLLHNDIPFDGYLASVEIGLEGITLLD